MEPDKFSDPILQGYYRDLCAADPADYEFRPTDGSVPYDIQKFQLANVRDESEAVEGPALGVRIRLANGRLQFVFWPVETSGNLFRKETNDATALGYNTRRTCDALNEYNMSILKRDGGPVIDCGCRSFTIEEAREHWQPENMSRWTQSTPEWGAVRRMQVEELVRQAREAGWDVPEETKETDDEYDPERWEFSPNTKNHGRKILSVTPVVESGAHFLTVTYVTGPLTGVGANTYADPRYCSGAFALRLKKPVREEVAYNITVVSEDHGVDYYHSRGPESIPNISQQITAQDVLNIYKVEKFNGKWASPVPLTLDELKKEAE